MVVPVDRVPKVSKHVGNGLRLDIPANVGKMLVVGNGCCLKIGKNLGEVKVVGDGCKIAVDSCPGSVEYIGNDGTVVLGDEAAQENVAVIGNNCHIYGKGEEVFGQKKEPTRSRSRRVFVTNVESVKGPPFDVTIPNVVVHLERTFAKHFGKK